MSLHLAEKDSKPGDDPAGPIPKEALRYFRRKKIRPGFSYTDVWQEEHRLAFTVAKLMERGVLETVRGSIEKALADGVPFAAWQKEVGPMLEQSGWREHVSDNAVPTRLRLIYDTNMRMARANGQHDRIQRTKKALPFMVYELGPALHHRPEHQSWAGLVLPVDDPFWQMHYPPSDYGCLCRVRQITRYEADQSGGPSESPPEQMVPYELPDGRTGEAPLGVHPSFAYPKGFDGRESALTDALETK